MVLPVLPDFLKTAGLSWEELRRIQLSLTILFHSIGAFRLSQLSASEIFRHTIALKGLLRFAALLLVLDFTHTQSATWPRCSRVLTMTIRNFMKNWIPWSNFNRHRKSQIDYSTRSRDILKTLKSSKNMKRQIRFSAHFLYISVSKSLWLLMEKFWKK